ncbi:hypothetical protein [Aliiroseovarius crassostreae]|uniref:hypothetical protein n=1 Tax=Aliiroseovarius crassostreae TaxID=154981 RepID=UPI003C7B34BA
MFRSVIPVLTLLLVTACATPQQKCISQASLKMRKAERQAAKIEKDLARGYALHRQTVLVPTVEICTDAKGKSYHCVDHDHRTIQTPVAIDADLEKSKLAALRKLIKSERPKVEAATKSCVMQFPE